MKRTLVTSSQMVSAGHDASVDELEIEFHPTKHQQEAGESGSIYRYSNVTQETFREMLTSQSVGSFFIQTIKKHPETYPYRRIY